MATNWRQMEAGRELDRAIAERLGHDVIERLAQWCIRKMYEDMATYHPLPYFSTSVDAAHPLMDGAYYEVCNQNGESDHGKYRLETFGEYGCIVYADTLAMVFCCAYLMRQERIEASHE